MTRAIGPRSIPSGSEVQARTEQALPLQFAPLAGGDWDEDAATRARRRRLRWQRAGGAAIALSLAAAFVLLVSRVYEARSALLIRPPNSNGAMPQLTDGALQSEIEILRSSDVVRQAIERVGVASLYPNLEDEEPTVALSSATDRLLRGLSVRTLPGSDVIEVTFRHGDASVAADIVNGLVERFQESRRAALAPAQSEQFLTERIAEQQQELSTAESALAAFHAENPGLASAEPRRDLAERRALLEAEQKSLRDAADAERTTGSSEDPSVVRARDRLDELELELQKTLNTHVDGSRAVNKVRHEIALVRDYLGTKEKTATREMARRLELLRTRGTEIDEQLAALAQKEREFPELEKQARELERVRDVAARKLDAYQRELEATTVAADVDEHKVAFAVRVLETARAPTIPLVPAERVLFAVVLTGLAGLLLAGAAFVDWLERRRTRSQPTVWTAHVGTGGEAGSIALLMGNQAGGPRGGPVVLLLSGATEGERAKGAGPASEARE